MGQYGTKGQCLPAIAADNLGGIGETSEVVAWWKILVAAPTLAAGMLDTQGEHKPPAALIDQVQVGVLVENEWRRFCHLKKITL